MDKSRPNNSGSSAGSNEASVGRGKATTVVLALAAALMGWGMLESHLFRVRPKIEQVNMMGVVYNDVSTRTRTAAELFELRGIMGASAAVLGLAMGLAGARSVRSWRAALVAAACGAAAGALVSIVAASIAVPLYERAEVASAGDLSRSIILHLALWAPMGATAGLAYALAARHGRAAPILAATAGAAGGAILYDVVGAIAFPLAETGKPLAAEMIPRLLGFLFVALGVAAGLVLAQRGAPAPPVRPTAG